MARFASVVVGLSLLGAIAAHARPATQLRLEKIATAREPVYVTAAPGEPDRLYVVQRRGLVRVLVDGRFEPGSFLDLTRAVSVRGEQGLFSIVFDPRYERNRFVYAMFTDRRGDIDVVRYRANRGGASTATARRLLVIAHRDSPFHNGGQLAFGPDGRLYVGTGDGGYLGLLPTVCTGRRPRTCYRESAPDPRGNAQNLSVELGKLLRVDVDAGGGAPTIVGYGLRNPWRFSFDRATGDLYVGDVGWHKFEELDYVPAGRVRPLLNFGWSVYEGTAKRTSGTLRTLRHDGPLIAPVLTYAHPPSSRARGCSASITAGYVYRGQAIPELRGRYLFGDYCTGRIWSIRMVAGKATDRRLEPVRVPLLTSFGEDEEGELYAVSVAGSVYRLVGG